MSTLARVLLAAHRLITPSLLRLWMVSRLAAAVIHCLTVLVVLVQHYFQELVWEFGQVEALGLILREFLGIGSEGGVECCYATLGSLEIKQVVFSGCGLSDIPHFEY
jgi:hypothetical protein